MIFQSLSVAKRDPGYGRGKGRKSSTAGLDKRWHFYYNTPGLRGYSGMAKNMLMLIFKNEKFLESKRREKWLKDGLS